MNKAPGWLLLMSMILSPGVGRAEEPVAQPDNLSLAENSWKDRKFTGSPISLNLKDADVVDVFRMIGDASGFNVILHPSVTGKITLSLEEVPWDQALEVVLSTLRLGAERSGSVLRILPRDQLISEAQVNAEFKKVAGSTAPRYTRIFPISYAEITQLTTLIQSYLGASVGTPATTRADPAPDATLIIPDPNTQSLIVRDTAEGLERIQKLIKLLDVQSPQIVIDAKVIDATETFSKAIEGKVAFGTNPKSVHFNGGDLAGVSTAFTPTGSANALKFGVTGSNLLNALLSYSEGESKAKVISSPRVLVMSGKSATINQTTNLAITQQLVVNGAVQSTVTFTPVPTTLTVTPKATNEGAVFMNLNFTRSIVQIDPSGQASPATRNVTTDVIVDSGNTLVLGGVQSISETESSTGMPFLRKIPIIGWLFGKETVGQEKSELMFFVTPRILNMKRAGLSDSASPPEEGDKATL